MQLDRARPDQRSRSQSSRLGSRAERVQTSPRARGEDALHAVQHVDEGNESDVVDFEHSTQLRDAVSAMYVVYKSQVPRLRCTARK